MTRRRWLRWMGAAGLSLFALGAAGVADAWSAFGARATGERRRRMRASPNFHDGRFVNPLPRRDDLWQGLKDWLRGGQHQVPERPVPVVHPDPADLAARPGSGLRLTWLGHSTVLLDVDGRRFLVDPVWGRRAAPSRFIGAVRFFPPPVPLADLPRLDAVVLTHDHYDHLDEPTIVSFVETDVRFVAPLGVGAHLERWGIAPQRITELDWWESTRVAGIELTSTPGRHFSGRSLRDRDATLWCGWVWSGPEHRVYDSGDTAMSDGFGEIGRRLGPFDATLIEIGAYNRAWADVHLGPEQAVQAQRQLGSGLLVPTHWGTFNLAVHGWTEPAERLIVAAAEAGVDIAIPRPGQSLEPAAPPQVVRWWPDLPWQTAAEAPVVSSGLQGSRRGPTV